MESKPPEQIIVDPIRVNLVFAGYNDFVNALEWPATIMTQAEKMGHAGTIKLSLDSGDTAEDKPLMSIFGPRAVVNVIVEGLEKEGNINFVIDMSESEEQDIVRRKWDNNSKAE